MITYIQDKDGTYNDQIIKHLRLHNHQFTNPKEDNKPYNVYVYDDENNVIGAWQTTSSWDWVNTTNMFYQNQDVLRHLIHYGYTYYKGFITGVKCFTTIKTQLDDMIEAGFEYKGMVEGTPLEGDTYYADLITLDESFEPRFRVVTSTDKREKEDTILKAKLNEYNKIHGIADSKDSISYVALSGEDFAGGVTCDIYSETMFVHLLAVNTAYRGNNIGSELMRLVENEAKRRGLLKITLGTAEFQARPFYEKLGYAVVFTRQNNPKGYECYTLEKDLY